MCVHPEATCKIEKFKHRLNKKYQTVYNKPTNLPSKAQWMIRNTHYESTEKEKFQQPETIEIIS